MGLSTSISVSMGSPICLQSSIFDNTRPSFTFCSVISASFTFTLTLSPSLRVATPSAIIFCTSLSSFCTTARKLSASRCLYFSDTTCQKAWSVA